MIVPPSFNFRQEIAEISLDQIGLPNTRKLAVVDKNRDLFVANVRQYKGGHGGGGSSGQQQSSGKIGAMVQSLKWNSDSNMLAALQGFELDALGSGLEHAKSI